MHKWTSLLCTIFLLMLCVTGLPLIFHDEIDRLTGAPPPAGPASSSNEAGLRPLDQMLDRALSARPGEVPVYMAFDNAGPLMTVTTAPRPDSPEGEMTLLILDRVTGEVVDQPDQSGVMDVILQIHTDMFLGLPGMLFLGAMGVLFVVAIVSGVVLYAPFMRKHDFGVLRTGRASRVKWLDWHNLAGIVALAWMTVVGVTGIINALATPLVDQWRSDALLSMTSAQARQGTLDPARYGSIDRAMAEARAALPGLNPQFIGFPGGSFSSGHHYAVFFQGATPLTRQLLIPALIDAETGRLDDVRPMPISMKALQLSQPLHFGDYGGLPLKILWAALTILTIVVLVSGLILWAGRRRSTLSSHLQEVTSGGRILSSEGGR
ncbi:PepSY-associated TM helix domain-containing protein [Sphingomonas sp. LY29]|uniref:PepSY-associated TM helix domain-containing protein n=1 Tax=Sphingomonas sp. LY29 TaxID=3095341 RepID=UPI002D77FDA2|nr:PepSY-associated TM helix domain-containing protein [Sphingomonas sp. LY29]WRP26849.1 PepSY-associated TM helix domain-containing protein [Sphingomonas sp. LY29]